MPRSLGRRLVARGAVGALVISSSAIVVLLPPRGAVLLIFTATHGVHAGDLVALAPLAGAGWLAPELGRRLVDGLHRVQALALVPVGAAIVGLGALDAAGALESQPDICAAALSALVIAGAAVTSRALAENQPPPPRHPPTTAPLACLAALVAGWLVDAVLYPSGTVVGPMLLTVTAAAIRWSGRSGRSWAVLAALLALVNVGALVDPLGVDGWLARGGGGDTRTLALGVAVALGGTADAICRIGRR